MSCLLKNLVLNLQSGLLSSIRLLTVLYLCVFLGIILSKVCCWLRSYTLLSNHGRPKTFFQGGNVKMLHILFRLLKMQCKCSFAKRFTLSILQWKFRMATVTQMRLVGSNSQAHCDNLHNVNRPSTHFQWRALLFDETLPWSLTNPQIMLYFT